MTPSVWACPLGCCGRAGRRKPALTQAEMEQNTLRKAAALIDTDRWEYWDMTTFHT